MTNDGKEGEILNQFRVTNDGKEGEILNQFRMTNEDKQRDQENLELNSKG